MRGEQRRDEDMILEVSGDEERTEEDIILEGRGGERKNILF